MSYAASSVLNRTGGYLFVAQARGIHFFQITLHRIHDIFPLL